MLEAVSPWRQSSSRDQPGAGEARAARTVATSPPTAYEVAAATAAAIVLLAWVLLRFQPEGSVDVESAGWLTATAP